VVKKFLPDGTEVAFCNGISAYKLFFDGEKIVSIKGGMENSIKVLDENLKTIKEIRVPKDLLVGNFYIENGVAFNPRPKLGEKEKFVYDVNNVNSQTEVKPQHDMTRFYQFEEKSNKKILVFKNKTWKSIRFSNYLPESIWDLGPHVYDQFGNIFLKTNFGRSLSYRPPNIMKDVGILKMSANGKPLCWIKLDRDMFAFYITDQVPWAVDMNGSVYGGVSEQDGFHIYRWVLKK
jgi:hypothetical protein